MSLDSIRPLLFVAAAFLLGVMVGVVYFGGGPGIPQPAPAATPDAPLPDNISNLNQGIG